MQPVRGTDREHNRKGRNSHSGHILAAGSNGKSQAAQDAVCAISIWIPAGQTEPAGPATPSHCRRIGVAESARAIADSGGLCGSWIDYSLTLENGKKVFNEQSISLKGDAQGNPIGFMVIVR